MAEKLFPGWFKLGSREVRAPYVKVHWFEGRIINKGMGWTPCGIILDIIIRTDKDKLGKRVKEPWQIEICVHCLKAITKHPYSKIAEKHPARSRIRKWPPTWNPSYRETR